MFGQVLQKHLKKYRFWPCCRILEVSVEHCGGCGWPAGALLLWTPGHVPFGTCICSNVDTILSWTCHVYGPFEFRTSLGTSILLIHVILYGSTYIIKTLSKNYFQKSFQKCYTIGYTCIYISKCHRKTSNRPIQNISKMNCITWEKRRWDLASCKVLSNSVRRLLRRNR